MFKMPFLNELPTEVVHALISVGARVGRGAHSKAKYQRRVQKELDKPRRRKLASAQRRDRKRQKRGW